MTIVISYAYIVPEPNTNALIFYSYKLIIQHTAVHTYSYTVIYLDVHT